MLAMSRYGATSPFRRDRVGLTVMTLRQRLDLPPLRNLAEFGVDEAVREEVGEVLGEAGVAAFGLGADGVEVHEPRLEERPRHRLQRLAHAAVELDLVVQRAEDLGDGALFVIGAAAEL